MQQIFELNTILLGVGGRAMGRHIQRKAPTNCCAASAFKAERVKIFKAPSWLLRGRFANHALLFVSGHITHNLIRSGCRGGELDALCLPDIRRQLWR